MWKSIVDLIKWALIGFLGWRLLCMFGMDPLPQLPRWFEPSYDDQIVIENAKYLRLIGGSDCMRQLAGLRCAKAVMEVALRLAYDNQAAGELKEGEIPPPISVKIVFQTGQELIPEGFKRGVYVRPEWLAEREAGEDPALKKLAFEEARRWRNGPPPGCGVGVVRAYRLTNFWAQPDDFIKEFENTDHYTLDQEIVSNGVVTRIYCLHGQH